MITDEEARQLEQRCVYNVYREMAPVLRHSHLERRPNVEQFLNSLPPGSLIADIGCGNGKYLRFTAGDRIVIGSDICNELVDVASRENNEVLVCDNLVLPYRRDMFDAVISISVLHHFVTSRRRRRALEELSRILRPGGVVLISVWAFEQAHRKFNTQDVLIPWKQDESSPKQEINRYTSGVNPKISRTESKESPSSLTAEPFCALCIQSRTRTFSATGPPEHSNSYSEGRSLDASKNGISTNGINLNRIKLNGVLSSNSAEDVSKNAKFSGVKPNGVISNGYKPNGVKLTLVNSSESTAKASGTTAVSGTTLAKGTTLASCTAVVSSTAVASSTTIAQSRLHCVRQSLSGLISRAWCSNKAFSREKSVENDRKRNSIDETFAVRQFPLSSYPELRENSTNLQLFRLNMYVEDSDIEMKRGIDDDERLNFTQDEEIISHPSKAFRQNSQENGTVKSLEQKSNVNCDKNSTMSSLPTARGNDLNDIIDAISRNSTMRFYHLFRESELENMISKYIPSLTVIESYYDHSNWCVVAKKLDLDAKS